MKLRKLLMSFPLILSVSLSSLALAQAPSQNVSGSQMGQANSKGTRNGRREQHPAIKQAIAALRRAKADMQHASHDFGGHRERALKSCDEAIEQLQQALNYDKQ